MQELKLFNKISIELVQPDSSDTLIRLLQAWRLWLVGIIVGAVLGGVAYIVFPSPYQAQATVVIDHNVDEVWKPVSDQYVWNYLIPEVAKLRDLAWSDLVLQDVVNEVPDVTLEYLRSGSLKLTYVNDGPWHFIAEDKDAQKAEQLANVWAEVFIEHVRENMVYTAELEMLRMKINELFSTGEFPPEVKVQVDYLFDQIREIEKDSYGISPHLDLYFSEKGNIRGLAASPGEYIFIGSFSGFILIVLFVIIFHRKLQ